MLNNLAKYHKEWLKIAYTFLNNKEDAEDCVQEMYIKIGSSNIKYDDRFDDGVNKYYIYITIRNMALDIAKKRKPDISCVDYIDEFEHTDDEVDHTDEILSDIEKEMESWTWYDRTIFEIYMYTELSMRDLAHGSDKTPRLLSNDKELCKNSILQGSNISVSSIYNTIKRCKERLRLNVIPNTKR